MKNRKDTPETSHEASEQTVENAEKLDQPWTPEPTEAGAEDLRTQAEKNDDVSPEQAAARHKQD